MTEASYGQLSFSSDPARLTYVEVTLDQPLTDFPAANALRTMREHAFDKVRLQGINPERTEDPFHFDVIRCSGTLRDEPGTIGVGGVGGRVAWVTNDSPELLARELGHKLERIWREAVAATATTRSSP
jgi:hypothetical protein